MSGPYSTKVMEHFANPRNVGEIENPDGVGNVGNPVCGDIMRMTIRVEDGVITDAKFKTFGCGAAIATSSMATELVKGKSIEEALKVTNKAVAESLGGLPPIKMHCSMLAEEALKSAIDDHLRRTTGEGLPGFKPGDYMAHEHEADEIAARLKGK
ncbi:MAG: Fe-S cluster assembly scaffold protein NifU [Armatimonadetes bacterium]|nr:Fe-S cluster assembly scaffold protein NifU [Armatimonadota bacterium]NIM23867.1 Fe-S cluster assembly scaffold protein NifU [Armatimonadota bacterium]NIM67746.1 Fe-S cluster assembly scaffold protein NifU [Armatimonadota bacterium]NIM76255.1 Fe-S cluster assembly scaffold protein NifU [Armatimonadota bacterium]NIN05948.1 Fe-S cluster assembly scaffold protein NifU [Armatimonadota bacterium]